MRTRIVAAAISLLVAGSALAGDQTWSGTISDKMCGSNHKMMRTTLSDHDCTIACAKGGVVPYVLLSGGKVYKLTNPAADIPSHAGHTVKVSGELKGDTIRVSKIEVPKK